jgi:hypothetical protein
MKPVPLRRLFTISKNGTQTLCLALLPAFFALFAYAFLGIHEAARGLNEISSKLQEYDLVAAQLHREDVSGNTITAIFQRIGRRLVFLQKFDSSMKSLPAGIELDSLHSKVMDLRNELKDDNGSLHQFNAHTYPYLHKVANALTNYLEKEDLLWVSLDRFVEKLTDKNTTAEEKNLWTQNYLNGLLEISEANRIIDAELRATQDELQSLKDEYSLKFNKLLAENETFWHSFKTNLILIAFSSVILIVLSFKTLGLRKVKKQTKKQSRIILP